MMKNTLSVLLVALLMVSCHHKKPIEPIMPPPPNVVVSPLNNLQSGQNKVDQVVKENVKLSKELTNAHEEINNQRVSIQDALDKLAKIKLTIADNGSASDLDIDDLILILGQIKQRNFLLEKSNKDLVVISKSQEKILSEVKSELDKAKVQVIQKDEEVSILRNQNDYYKNVITTQQESISKLEKDISKKEKKLASASVYKNWVIGIVAAIIIWFIIKKALLVYAPPIGRRLW